MPRRLADDHLDNVRVAQRSAGRERVLDVVFKAVLRIKDARDATLGVVAVGLLDDVLRDDSTESCGSTAIAARNPAMPPPMTSTSAKKCGCSFG
jgi:hypothetical protein